MESLRMPASIDAPMEASFSPRTCAPDAQGIQEHLASRTKAAATTRGGAEIICPNRARRGYLLDYELADLAVLRQFY